MDFSQDVINVRDLVIGSLLAMVGMVAIYNGRPENALALCGLMGGTWGMARPFVREKISRVVIFIFCAAVLVYELSMVEDMLVRLIFAISLPIGLWGELYIKQNQRFNLFKAKKEE